MVRLLCGAFLALAPLAVSAQPAAVASTEIDRDMQAAIAQHQATGITIAVIRDGAVVYEHAYGLRDAAQNLPATISTQYEIGSITKQFTAAAVMQLVGSGKISLDAKLADYLPQAPHAAQVTIRELLSHTSGEPEYLDGKDVEAAAAHPVTFDQLMARIAGKPLDFTPGTQWEYSNTNYIVLGRLIEVASGEPYEKYLFDHVLAKAPGANLATMSDEGKLPEMSRGYASGKPAPPLDNSWAWSAGNLVGTVGDMIAWDAALSSGEVVPPSAYAAMTTAQTPPGSKIAYGFAFVLDRYDEQPRVWHNGGTFGFRASDQFYPDQHTRIIVFTNDGDCNADLLADRVFDDLYPKLAATQMKPATGEDPAFTARVKAVFEGMLAGHMDHTQFTPGANARLTDAVVASAVKQFSTLGTPKQYIFRGCTQQGTTRVCKYRVIFTQGSAVLTVGTAPDGKFDMIFLGPQ
jgi:D-alanyl-D-alanine carboxypeptidase